MPVNNTLAPFAPLPDRRSLLAFLIMAAVALMIASMDIYTPAMPLMRDYFGTSDYFMQLSVMAGPFASALVGMVYGRLSDIYGRRPLLFSAFAFFLAGGLACCFATTMDVFFISRFIQSVGSGGISILGVVVVGEMFHGVQYARYMAIYGTLFPVVFALAPITGAQMTHHFGWRSCFILVFVAMLVVALLLHFLLPETLKKGGHANKGGWKELIYKWKTLLKSREFILMALGHSLPICLSCIFSTSAAFIFIDGYRFSPTGYAYLQAIPIAFNFAGLMAYRHFIPLWGLKGALKIGFGGLVVFIISIMAVISGQLPDTPFIIIAAICLANISMPFIVASCATRAFEIFPDDKGLSVSMVALIRNLSVTLVVCFSALFFNGTIYPVFIAMLMAAFGVLGVLGMTFQRPVKFS